MLVQVKLEVVIVGIDIILELLPVDFVQHVIYNLHVEVRLRVKLEQFLVLSVEHNHEHFNTAETGKFDRLFEETSLPLAHGHFPLDCVLDKAWLCMVSHFGLSWKVEYMY